MDAVLASTIDILEDVVKLPDWQQELAFTEPRHTELINGLQSIDGSWRLKERVKTVSVALVLCLNVGVDPPDVVKIEPAAHLECWFDPLSEEPQKAIEYISVQLEKQYEQWHSRARYKKCLDPTVDEVKRLCTSLRRYSKEDRVLLHYNGHGVPRPTQNGEIWVFNEKYTQYIPLAIYDLQQWMGAPSIYVFDCSCAGSIVDSFLEFAKQHKKDHELEMAQYNAHTQRLFETGGATVAATDAATNAGFRQPQITTTTASGTTTTAAAAAAVAAAAATTTSTTTTLPTSQQQGNILQNKVNVQNTNDSNKAIAADTVDSAPSPKLADPSTIESSTAPSIPADTTAHVRTAPVKPPNYESCFHLAACEAHQILPMQPDLPADLFTSCLTTPIKMALRWFIQKNDSGLIPKVTLDLVDKIPGSLSDRRTMLGELNWIFTAITDTIAWDVLPRDLFQRLYRQDLLVASLFRNFLLADRIMRTYDCTPVSHPRLPKTYHHPMWRAWDMVVDLCLPQLVDVLEDRAPFRTSTFFAEQLTAFEVWLDMDHSSNQQPNHQLLPIILQVLLSPVHRLRALDLLSRFLNLGPGAVNSALSVGIFPYVLKLLQSNAREVRPFLLSIWAKILAIDRRCQVDLVRDHYHRYFLTILSDGSYDAHYRTMAAFVLTCIVRDYPIGQEVAYQANLIAFCLEQLDDPDPMLKKWLAICLGCSWDNYDGARWCGVRSNAHEKLYTILDDPDPEVRAASVYALGTFINNSNERTDHANTIDHSIGMKLVSSSLYDSSVLVRHELVVALQYLVLAFESQFIKLEQAAKEEEGRTKHNDANAGQYDPRHAHSHSHGHSHGYSHSHSHGQQQQQHLHLHQNQYHGANLSLGNHIPRVNSLNAIPLLFGASSKIVSNVYHIIWKAMYTLAADPHPRVSSAAQIIIDEIRSRSYQGMSTESLKESKSNSSISEASSPNTATFSISESPPSITTTTTTTMAGARKNLAGEVSATAGTLINAVASAFTSHSPSANSTHNHHNQRPNQNHQPHAQEQHNYGAGQAKHTATCDSTTPASNSHQQAGATHSVSKPQQVPLTNAERVGKSPNLAINSHLSRPKHRYALSRDHNASEDDNKSNMSSQRPLISTDLVDWCTKYFVDPENNFTSSRGSSSKEDQQREWRMLRVMSYRNVCLRELMIIDPARFNETVTNYRIQQVPSLLTVHPYDPVMIVASKDEFSVLHSNGAHLNNYDYNTGLAPSSSLAHPAHYSGSNLVGGNQNHHHHNHQHHHHHSSNILLGNLHHNHTNGNNGPSGGGGGANGLGGGSSVGGNLDNHNHGPHDLIGTQRNCHSSSSHITSLQLINPQYNSLVSVGSSDGSVRIWRAYNGIDYTFNPQLVTAFHLMPELQPLRQGLGMILLWDQNQGQFYATSDQNDVRIIKVWDAASESKVQDIPTCAEYGVSCLSSDGEHSIAAGFLDGSIRIYDTRLKKTDCRTFTFRKHSERILALHMFKPGEKHINLVSGDSGGEVRFWDKRAPTSVKRVDVGQRMSVMTMHPNADVFACGLKSGQGIRIYNLDGTSRAACTIKCQDNHFFNSRHNPSVSCLAFHPLMASLVAGYSDAVISTYSSRVVP